MSSGERAPSNRAAYRGDDFGRGPDPTEGSSNLWKWVGVGAIGLILLVLLVGSCEAPTGDIEGQVLGMRSTSEQPVQLQGAAILIAGARIDCGQRSDSCVAQTDPAGHYRFADVPEGDYGLLFLYEDPTFAEGKPLGSQGRQVNVSKDAVETVSTVLLPEGMDPPPVPPDIGSRPPPRGGYRSGTGGVTDSPFFWLWLFNRPYSFGYPRPPVVVVERSGGPVTTRSDQPQTPSRTGRRYTTYAASSRGGAKVLPQHIQSKGIVRPGAVAAGAGARTGPSQGVARPGAAAVSSSTRSAWGRQVTTTVRPPPRIGGPSVRGAGSARRGGGFGGGGK